MKSIAMIPARYAASRFPGKLMQMLGEKTVIRHTYENTVATRLFDEVMVVTDNDLIFNEITHYGGYAVRSKGTYESGSDRIAEAVADIEVDVVVNVQGDEPFVRREPLLKLLSVFEGDITHQIKVASLMLSLKDEARINDPNVVKVVVDKHMNSLLFSRSVIPYPRSASLATAYFEHVGVYAFRKQALLDFTTWPITPLEEIENIECLRYLENGIPLKMVLSEYMAGKIDTPADLENAILLLNQYGS